MFEQQEAPIRISTTPTLGDLPMAIDTRVIGTPEPPTPIDPRVARLEIEVLRLTRRVAQLDARLDAQRWSARWARFCAWVRGLWR